jgi:hypothetical protein
MQTCLKILIKVVNLQYLIFRITNEFENKRVLSGSNWQKKIPCGRFVLIRKKGEINGRKMSFASRL